MIDRRSFLKQSVLFGTATTVALPSSAQSQTTPSKELLLKGSLDATHIGVRPGVLDDQSRQLQKAIDLAVAENKPLFLPGGTYTVSNINLKSGLMLTGVSGATRLLYSGDGHLLFGTRVERLLIENIILDGAHQPFADYAPALLHLSTARDILIQNCHFVGSQKDGIHLDRVEGRFTGNKISGIKGAAFKSNEAKGLEVSSNDIRQCGDNGIQIWRWEKGPDATLVINNRIEDIKALSGGTGPFGNGINIFRADNVIVANNVIDNCDFSAIRFNSASNAQINNNNCKRSGEVAIYAEFGFEGAVIANNIIDGAASGISITNFDHGGRLGIAQGNLIRNLYKTSRLPTQTPHYGIGIVSEADSLLSGNLIENAPYAGMMLGWGPYLRDVSAMGNVIRQSLRGILVSVEPSVGKALISDNIISKTQKGAIIGMLWTKVATKDLAGANTLNIPKTIKIERNQTLYN